MPVYPESCYLSPNIVACSMIWRIYVIVVVDIVIILYNGFESIRSLVQICTKNHSANIPRILFWTTSFFFVVYRVLTWILPLDEIQSVLIPVCMSIPALLIQLPAFFLAWSLYNYTERLNCRLGDFSKGLKKVLFVLWGIVWIGFGGVFVYMYSTDNNIGMIKPTYILLAVSDLFYAPLILFPCYVNIKVSIEMFPDFSSGCVKGTWAFFWTFVVCIFVRIFWRVMILFGKPSSVFLLPFTMPTTKIPSDLDRYLTAVIIYTLVVEWIPLIMPQIGITTLMKKGDERADEISFISWNEWV